jgi:hypothetical protein
MIVHDRTRLIDQLRFIFQWLIERLGYLYGILAQIALPTALAEVYGKKIKLLIYSERKPL